MATKIDQREEDSTENKTPLLMSLSKHMSIVLDLEEIIGNPKESALKHIHTVVGVVLEGAYCASDSSSRIQIHSG